MENAKKTKYFLTEGIADDREARDYQICSNMRGFKPRILQIYRKIALYTMIYSD